MDNGGLKQEFIGRNSDVTGEVFDEKNFDLEQKAGNFGGIEADKGDEFLAEGLTESKVEMGENKEVMTMPPIIEETTNEQKEKDEPLSGDVVEKVMRIAREYENNPALLNKRIDEISKTERERGMI